ncbi:hypothetical protein BGZ57DRAFT_1005827 [Hyaloscypha finlandica]|nr:hypothetical protein BGZ57DRAFT_1005827 [Hyaloscypha finlandica]
MFSQQWTNRKRAREDDEENVPSGFNEHRTKRHIAALPHRTSPKLARNVSPTFSFNTHYTSQPAPPTITPADSDSEDTPLAAEPRSFFSPYSSSPTTDTLTQSGSPSPWLDSTGPSHDSSQSTQMSDAPAYSDDLEMTDSIHFSPGSSHNDPSTSITGRIPTPIHSSFAPFIRAEKASMHHDVDFADDEAMVDRFRRGRRLPSPISEGETSPSVIVAGFGDMQMEVENSSHHDKETPTKKGHQRSKHSLRNWTGLETSSPTQGLKRSFSMGYRADCEKCRMKVPGHFSHIITY